MKTNLHVYFEVFNADDTNEYIKSFNDYKQAKEFATQDTEKNYSIDMVVELLDDNGERITSDGDALFSVQVFPNVPQYKNYNKRPELLTK